MVCQKVNFQPLGLGSFTQTTYLVSWATNHYWYFSAYGCYRQGGWDWMDFLSRFWWKSIYILLLRECLLLARIRTIRYWLVMRNLFKVCFYCGWRSLQGHVCPKDDFDKGCFLINRVLRMNLWFILSMLEWIVISMRRSKKMICSVFLNQSI